MPGTRILVTCVTLLALVLSGCQALSATGQALGNSFANGAGKSEGSTRIPLNNDDFDLDRLGVLDWLGGLKLTSPNAHFGGLSGILISDDGSWFLSVSDKGFWVRGSLSYQQGMLTGAHDIKIAPMLGLAGEPIEGKTLGDAESLIGDPAGHVMVSFERQHRVWAYDLSKDGFSARPVPIALPPEVKTLKSNGGLEGIATLKDSAGTLLVLSEDTLDAQGNMKGWLVRPGGTSSVSLKAMLPFKLTDLAVLPNGDVLTLERRFTPIGGPGYQIRRLDGASIQPGAVLDGPVLASAGMPFSVDNMEGLDVRRTDDGRLLLYLVSDDNFNALQRTLLMMFELKE